jgi:eukaryotic-like serine/threonine-protein kinase
VVEDPAQVKYTADLTGKILGGYRIDAVIGKGSMGTVYRANQLSLAREVALKVLDYNLSKDINFVKSFLNEARAAGKLNHPNVVHVHDVGEADGYYFFSMEYVANGSLSAVLEQKGRLAVKEGLAVLLGIARALEYAEQQKIIHCDIKPDNIMLSATGEAKLADLGIARQMRGAKVEQVDRVFGSPDYIAPEQAKGLAIDHRVDIYALGISAYEILSGRVPFTGKTTNEIIKKHVYEKPRPLAELVSDLPPMINDLVMKMIAKTPEERPASAAELVKLFGDFLQKGTAPLAAPAGKPAVHKHLIRRRLRRRR